MGVALRCVGLSKTFRIYLRPMDILRELLTGRAHAVERQALADISLDVYRGEVVGILGRNGAGKSTLLKIVAGTLDRTAGSVETHGRITAILELGTGFHPDYSGRENIKLGGLCMGMTPAEVARKTDTIIEFSELRDVIDQPFRTYSTGMQARLTFATAISVDPDILVVDEALAVGDARFQMRCFARISELRARGCTILLVSHDISTITQFCDRAVILEQGRIHTIGTAKEVASKYLRLLFEPKNTALAVPVAPSAEATDGSGPTAGARFGDGAMKLTGYEWLDEAGQPIQVLQTGQRCQFRMTAVAVRPVEAVSCGFAIKNRLGTVLFGMTNISSSQPMTNIAVGETLEITSDLVMWLSAGDYFVNFGFGHADGELSDFIDSGLHFTVHGPGNIFTTAVVNLQATYQIARWPREAPESAPATPRSTV
jgi:ABC-type polysaccharide/polyol phosphate transport system ATPase subunit